MAASDPASDASAAGAARETSSARLPRPSSLIVPRWGWVLPALVWLTASARFHRMFQFQIDGKRVWALADDIYISACFGRTLLSGEGALWYPGAPRVEGITNPLWSLLIGVMHAAPGFREAELGLWVVGFNGLLLLLVAQRAFRIAAPASLPGGIALAALLCPLLALPYWGAEGYEVVLVALLALLALDIAARDGSRGGAIRVGLLLGLGMWTRMDAALVFGAALITLLSRPGSRAARVRNCGTALALGVAMLGALVVARVVYYGDPLPNTYYLKATGWPLAARLAAGRAQNGPLLLAALTCGLPLLVPGVRRALGPRLGLCAGCLVSFIATVAYSTYVGGDSWHLKAGFDRHTVVGALLLCLGLGIAVIALASDWSRLLLWLPPALLLSLSPMWQSTRADWLAAHLMSDTPPMRTYERKWIRYGQSLEEITRPGARIALCPAGAIVYFSHRGGIDLLGKVEPQVAHLNVRAGRDRDSRCWQPRPGHLKEDTRAVFDRQRPELSRHQPPSGHGRDYRRVRYEGQIFFARRDTHALLWDRVEPAPRWKKGEAR